jgi:L-malate glycosyltransferase
LNNLRNTNRTETYSIAKEKHMKIAINCHPTQGGSGIVATELAMALADRGHEVFIVACERPFRLPRKTPVHFRKVYVLDYPLFKYPPHDFALINKLVETTLKYDIDILHAHYMVPHAICAVFARTMLTGRHTKVVSTLHGTDITLVGSHPEFRDICLYAMTQSDALTSVSRWLTRKTCEEFGICRNVHVISNFIDVSRFHPSGRSGYPSAGKEFIFMHAGNFRPVKRVADICRIFYDIQTHVPARLNLVGKGPEIGDARELCAELGISKQVDFPGSLSDIENEMRKTHFFLLMSQYESFGLSALEAMGCGVPVAASHAGGLPEVIEDGVSGILAPVGDTHGAAQRILEVVTDRSRWEAMSRAAALRARHFDRDAIVSQYETVYRDILAT